MHPNKDAPTPAVAAQIAQIHQERFELLKLPGEQALERILNAHQPAALVHSLSVEDFYFLINDIGLHDALPLLSLASFRQWDYILDIELWDNDRLSPHAGLWWMDLLLKVDPQRNIKWTVENHIPLFELLLFRNIEVYLKEPGFDPTDLHDDLFTVDDFFYVRFKHGPSMQPSDDNGDDRGESPEQMLQNLLEGLASYDYTTYQRILLEAASVIPAEVEEEAYRMRNVRLAERGFLPYHEAVGVYQPLKPKDIQLSSRKYLNANPNMDSLTGVPFYPLKRIEASNHFVEALLEINTASILQQIQFEFAGLCNQVAVADQKKIKSREQLQKIVAKTAAYIHIGLGCLKENLQPPNDPKEQSRQYREFIMRVPLSRIFRVGYGQVHRLHWKAKKWRRDSWFELAGLPLTFWDEGWLGVLGGLLIRRPRFYDNYRTGELYRDFKNREDIDATETVLNQIINVDALLNQMKLQPPPKTDALVTWKNLILTLWARHFLGLDDQRLKPLSAPQIERFFGAFRSDWKNPSPQAAMNRDLWRWLASRTGFAEDELRAHIGALPDDLLRDVKEEYDRVAADDLDPRYIHLFLTDRE